MLLVSINENVLVHIDDMSSGHVRGWVLDKEYLSSPRSLLFYMDDEKIEAIEVFSSRKDVLAAKIAGEFVGFEFQLPDHFLDGSDHILTIKSLEGEYIEAIINGSQNLHLNFNQKYLPKIVSHVDGMREGKILGWVLTTSKTGELEGGATVSVYFNGRKVSQVRANKSRFDVGKSLSADHKCGFEYKPTKELIALGAGEFKFELSEYQIELNGSPIKASFFNEKDESFILEMGNEIDELSRRIEKIRRRMRFLAPKKRFDLSNYSEWYDVYNANMHARFLSSLASTNRDSGAYAPLVSIICPVFRPNLEHFKTALESLLAQSYQNIEIILIDDFSRDSDLSSYMKNMKGKHSNIKVLRNRKNLGISASTNLGIKNSSGEWIVFFDHDDLMNNMAIEMMVSCVQKNRDLKLIYTDEDKIDDDGVHSEPAFKPNFNYRLLLSVNYICHLVMISRKTIDIVGQLDEETDGAQDHDFLLRVCEHISEEEVFHLGEILYHWRKSENSTALQTSAKTYAIDAGIKSVRSHLGRRGVNAVVTNINSSTWYSIYVKEKINPTVTIVIPFKDQIETTKKCIDTIIKTTKYKKYDIILANNWSISTQFKTFKENISNIKNIKMIDIEEDFNYSRINNIAIKESNSDYIVLMNNDLFVIDENWLHRMIGEFYIQESVGIVGGRFFYPNETVQHAGVVLGVGGVACHAFAGLKRDDPGYGARSVLSQEVSAVTAACLIIKKSIFDEVGGLDEKELTVAFNDVDLCMKVRSLGYKVIYNAEFIADHHESLSRGEDDIDPFKETRFFHEKMTMIERWGSSLINDEFYPEIFDKSVGRTYFDLLAPDELPPINLG